MGTFHERGASDNEPTSAPIIAPPKCPPTDTPGTAKVKTRLIANTTPSPVRKGLTPRWPTPTTLAAMSPKTAPDAPPVAASGESNNAPSEPPSRAAQYSNANRSEPMTGSMSRPSWYNNNMLKPTWMTPKCTNPDEISRYHSPCSRNTREITKLSARSLVLLPNITEPTSPRVIQMKIPTFTAISELPTTNGGTLPKRRVELDGRRNSNGTRAAAWRRGSDAAGRSRRGSGGGNCGGGRLTAGQPRQQPD